MPAHFTLTIQFPGSLLLCSRAAHPGTDIKCHSITTRYKKLLSYLFWLPALSLATSWQQYLNISTSYRRPELFVFLNLSGNSRGIMGLYGIDLYKWSFRVRTWPVMRAQKVFVAEAIAVIRRPLYSSRYTWLCIMSTYSYICAENNDAWGDQRETLFDDSNQDVSKRYFGWLGQLQSVNLSRKY